MSDLTYCEYCLENLEAEMFDYRFEEPVCLKCAESLGLEPDENGFVDDLDDFPLSLEYDEGGY